MSIKMRRKVLLLATLIIIAVPVFATKRTASTSSQLSSAIAASVAGDTIIMTNGTWNNVTINFNNTKATALLPIVILAQTPGKVILTGTSSLVFAGPYLVVDGLYFKSGALNSGSIVRFNSNYCRFTNSAIVNYNPINRSTTYYWIYFDGSNNRVDNCYFRGKNHLQPCVGNDTGGARYNQVDRCYFKDIGGAGQGSEVFRIWGYGGNEELGTDGAFFTVESNLFDAADGEGLEMISIKSNRNIVRNNTIVDTKGEISIRSGNFNTIDGNFIFGNKKLGSRGIRMVGQYQKIVNNYIENVEQSGIIVYTGEYIDTYLTPNYKPINRAGTPLGRVPAYGQVKYALIAHNTIVNPSALGIEMGAAYKVSWPTSQRVLLPESCTVANNVIVKTSGIAIRSPKQDVNPPLDVFTFAPNTYEGNIIYGGSNSLIPQPESGITTQDPLLALTEGLYRPASNSPLIDTGAGAYTTEDMDGQQRDSLPDIGADEVSTSIITRKPLTGNDVGPGWVRTLAPEVTVTSPGNKSIVETGTVITLRADAITVDANVTKVEFFINGVKVGEDTSKPYSLSWTSVAGVHLITAKSYDDIGREVISPAIELTVKSQTPYLGITRSLPGKIEAEDFDEGGEGMAYHETTAGNNYNVYRFENVDIQPCGDIGGGFNIALVAAGEWIEYTVNVDTAGTYRLDLRLATTQNGRTCNVQIDGVNVSGTVAIPNTGAFQVYKTVSVTTPPLTTGKKVMRITFDTSTENLNWVTFTLKQKAQAITFDPIDVTFGTAPIAVTANANTGLPVSLEVVSGPAELDSTGLLMIIGAGEVTLRATQAGNSVYLPASADYTFTVQKAAQVITFPAIETRTYNDAPFDLQASVNSGLSLSFEVVSGPATLAGETLTITGVGEVTVRASQDGDENYLPSSIEQTFTVNKAPQNITFITIGEKTYGDEPFTLEAAANTGFPVVFEVLSGPATISGSALTILGAGDVTVRVSQEGNENYLPASAEQTFTVNKAAQTITFNTISNKTYGDAAFELTATANETELPVAFEIVSGPATIAGATLSITGAGDVTVRARVDATENYLAAAVEQTFTVNKAEQTITFPNIDPQNIHDIITLNATSTSGLLVLFDVISGPGVLAGNSLSFYDTDFVVIEASQPGNENYLPASTIEQAILVYSNDCKGDGVKLIVHPNPTRGKLRVKLDNKKDKQYAFAVYDDHGNVVASNVIPKSHKMFEVEFDLTNSPIGLYYLWVSDGTLVTVKRIIKE